MMQTQSQGQIKLNRRGLTELILACSLISLLTFAFWSWQTSGGRISAMEMPTTEPQSALLPKIILDPTIMLTTIIAEFAFLLAVTLALVPPKWWLQIDRYLESESNEPSTPLEWLGHKITNHKAPAHGQAQGQVQYNQAGEPVYYEAQPMPGMVVNPYSAPPNQQTGVQPGQPVPGQMQPGQPIPGQMQPGQPFPGQMQPGQPAPGQMQPGQPIPGQAQPGQPIPGQAQPGQPVPGQAQPGQPVPGQAQPGQVQPGQPTPGNTHPATVTEVQPQAQGAAPAPMVPPAPLSDVLNFEEDSTDDPLADLADIGDILTSAFDEDAGIDPDREALGKSLDDLEIKALLKSSRTVLATFQQ